VRAGGAAWAGRAPLLDRLRAEVDAAWPDDPWAAVAPPRPRQVRAPDFGEVRPVAVAIGLVAIGLAALAAFVLLLRARPGRGSRSGHER
jgi:hypothetical protein